MSVEEFDLKRYADMQRFPKRRKMTKSEFKLDIRYKLDVTEEEKQDIEEMVQSDLDDFIDHMYQGDYSKVLYVEVKEDEDDNYDIEIFFKGGRNDK